MSIRLSAHERSYRALMFLYPRSFRREYAGEMVLAFGDDVANRGSRRAWMRVAGDLTLSVPTQHLEAAMTRRATVRTAQAALATSVLLVIAVLAHGRYVITGVPIAVAVGGLALLYMRSQLPYREALAGAGSSWWRMLAAGAGLLAGIGLVANYGPDVAWFPWHLAAFLYLAAWALMIAGAVAGLVHGVVRLRGANPI